MKINDASGWRKHGRQARLRVLQESDTRAPAATPARVTTTLTFTTTHQAYLWTTDRGRSRLIKR